MDLGRGQKDVMEWPFQTGEQTVFDVLPQDQEFANYGWWAKCSSPPIFLSMVLSGDSYIHSFKYCLGCFCAALVELSSCDLMA